MSESAPSGPLSRREARLLAEIAELRAQQEQYEQQPAPEDAPAPSDPYLSDGLATDAPQQEPERVSDGLASPAPDAIQYSSPDPTQTPSDGVQNNAEDTTTPVRSRRSARRKQTDSGYVNAAELLNANKNTQPESAESSVADAEVPVLSPRPTHNEPPTTERQQRDSETADAPVGPSSSQPSTTPSFNDLVFTQETPDKSAAHPAKPNLLADHSGEGEQNEQDEQSYDDSESQDDEFSPAEIPSFDELIFNSKNFVSTSDKNDAKLAKHTSGRAAGRDAQPGKSEALAAGGSGNDNTGDAPSDTAKQGSQDLDQNRDQNPDNGPTASNASSGLLGSKDSTAESDPRQAVKDKTAGDNRKPTEPDPHTGVVPIMSGAKTPERSSKPSEFSSLVPSGKNTATSEKNDSQKSRPSTEHSTMRKVVGITGEALATLGVLVLLFVGWTFGVRDPGINQAEAAEVSTLSNQWDKPKTITNEMHYTVPPTQPDTPSNGSYFGVMYAQRLGNSWSKPIIAGTSTSNLNKGIGWYSSTQLPGQEGNFAVAGHRNNTSLINIDKFQLGDKITIETSQGWYVYSYRNTEYVMDTKTSVLNRVPDRTDAPLTSRLLTLQSCNPYPVSNGERIIAYAVFDYFVPRASGTPEVLNYYQAGK